MAGNSFRICNVFGAGCTILLFTAIPVALITVGAVYICDCPVAPAIPVYMMVCGILALLLMGLLFLPRLLCPAASGHIVWTLGILILCLFAFIWFLYGSYQIYSVYPPNYDKNITRPVNSTGRIYAPTAPDSKLRPTMENQSLPNLNQSWISTSNQTFKKLIKTLALSSLIRNTNRGPLHAPQVHPAIAMQPYCNKHMYLFVFWTTTLTYVLTANTLLILICTTGFLKFADYFATITGM